MRHPPEKTCVLTRLLGAATAQARRVAHMQDEAEKLQHPFSSPIQECAVSFDATRTSHQPTMDLSQAFNSPVAPASYGCAPLRDTPLFDVSFHDASTNNIASEMHASDIPFDHGGMGDITYGWTNWNAHPTDQVYQQPHTQPGASNQYISM